MCRESIEGVLGVGIMIFPKHTTVGTITNASSIKKLSNFLLLNNMSINLLLFTTIRKITSTYQIDSGREVVEPNVTEPKA